MSKTISLGPGEKLLQWRGTKPPVELVGDAPPEGATYEVEPGFQGVAIRTAFLRGRMPVDQFFRDDTRFLEPIGISAQDMIRPAELGYYRSAENEAPKKLTSLAMEMAARVAGRQVMSPRDGDRVETWDYTEGSVPGRLVALLKDGMVMSAESGRGDSRPELLLSPEECVATGELRTTNKTREQNLSLQGMARQSSLFDGAVRPLPSPATPEREMRDFLLGGR